MFQSWGDIIGPLNRRSISVIFEYDSTRNIAKASNYGDHVVAIVSGSYYNIYPNGAIVKNGQRWASVNNRSDYETLLDYLLSN